MRTFIHKILMLAATGAVLVACEKDENRVVLNITTAPSLTASTTNLVLLQSNANNNAVTFTWTAADFGFDAAKTYELQISKDANFVSATTTSVALSSTSFTKTFTVLEFNRELLKVINHSTPTEVHVRVMSSVGSSSNAAYSNVVKMNVTAYRDLITYTFPQALNVAGNFQGWNPGNAPQLVNTNNGGYNGYEGYINFNNANPEFKLVKGNNWGAGDYGSAGGNALGNGGPNLTLPDGAGIYRVRANTTNLTWSYTKINSWGLIGDATPDGWNSDQNMTYNPATGVWSITLNLNAGNIKFRANDAWAINLGDNQNPLDFKPEYDGSNIPIAVAGNYTITLDLSAGGNYAYTIKKN